MKHCVSKEPKIVVNRRKISALSRLFFDIPVSEYHNYAYKLQAMLDCVNHKNEKHSVDALQDFKCSFQPLFSPQACNLRKEVLNISLAEAKEIQQAHDLVCNPEYKDMCSSIKLESLLAFPPEVHAQAMKGGCKVRYRLYENEFLNMLNADRHSVPEAKEINRLVLTCITTSASIDGLQQRVRESNKVRSEVNMDRVSCACFGQCVMSQIMYALGNLLEKLPTAEPALMHRKEDLCYLKFMAHSLFDKDSQPMIHDLYDTKHSSCAENAELLRVFLLKKVTTFGLKPISAALNAPDRTRSLYAGLIGSIAANALIAAYTVRCKTAAPSKIDIYTKCLQEDYNRTKFHLSAASLPVCIQTLGPGSSVDKRLLLINAYDRLMASDIMGMKAHITLPSKLEPETMHVVNNVISVIHGGHNKADGVSERPIYEGSEYSFNHFNDMSTYAVKQVIDDIVDALHNKVPG